MKKLLAITTSLFILLASILKAQEITTSGFEPNKVRPSSIASYTITVSNVDGTADLNDISAKIPQGLKLLDQDQQNFNNISWENGVTKKESGIKLSLSFSAEKEGSYTIGAWNAKVGDKLYPMPAHTLIVDSNAPVYAQQHNSNFTSRLDPIARMQQMMGGSRFQQRQPAERVDLSNLVSAKIKLAKDKIYVGESVPCEIILEVDKELMSRAQIELSRLIPSPRDTDAFVCQELSEKPTASSDAEKLFYSYKTVITPNKVGSYPLSFNLQGVFGGRAFFSSSYNFDEVAKIDAVNVSPLPNTNVPSSFTGAIGEFKLAKTSIEPSSASVGELILQSFTIEGVGNFDRISPPKLESNENWKVYEPTSKFEDKDSSSFLGEKTFNYRMVAQKPDLEYAQPLAFSYFNPVKQEYVTIEIPSQKLSISPAARINTIAQVAPIASGSFDIVSENNPSDTNTIPLFARVEFWIYQVIIVAFIVLAIVYRRRVLFLKANPAVAKNSREKRAARIQLKFAKKYAYESNAKNFFEASIKAIQFSLSRLEDIQAPSITLKDAQKLLEKRGLDIKEIDKFFNSLDAINYAGSKANDYNLMQLEKELRDICKNLLR